MKTSRYVVSNTNDMGFGRTLFASSELDDAILDAEVRNKIGQEVSVFLVEYVKVYTPREENRYD